jgi:HAD superfamily hydrolase (TIGR01509 family)
VTRPAAVVFDLDGVLIDSEAVWNDARRELVERSGGTWRDDAQRAMMGMSSVEWSRYMSEELEVPMSSEDISDAVVESLERRYREELPLIPGAREAVVRLAARWRLGLASSANRPVIELALREAELTECFAAAISSEEVARGKPAPDVYLEAARKLDTDPAACVAVEDSTNGLRSAAAAGMGVIAIPNPEFPPEGDALALADVRLGSIRELGPEAVERSLAGPVRRRA